MAWCQNFFKSQRRVFLRKSPHCRQVRFSQECNNATIFFGKLHSCFERVRGCQMIFETFDFRYVRENQSILPSTCQRGCGTVVGIEGLYSKFLRTVAMWKTWQFTFCTCIQFLTWLPVPYFVCWFYQEMRRNRTFDPTSPLAPQNDVLMVAFNDRVAPASLSIFTGYGWVLSQASVLVCSWCECVSLHWLSAACFSREEFGVFRSPP